MKRGNVGFSAIVVLAFALAMPAYGQTAKPKPKPPPKSAPAITQGEEPKPLEFGDVGPDFDMPATWPSPAPLPAGGPEAAAMALANDVLMGGDKALPAIQRAALESGISIRNEAGEILHAAPQASDLGLSISDFELAVAAYATHRRESIEFQALNTVYAADPRLSSMDLKSLLDKSLILYQGGAHPGKRFWSNFVRAFGLNPESPFSTLFAAQTESAMCSAQLVWLTYIAAGQMHAAFSRDRDQPLFPRHGPFANATQRPSQMVAMRNLQLVVQHLGQGPIAQHIQNTVSQGNDPAWAMLELAASELIRAGTRVTGTLRNSPLIRTKTRGQTGGDSTLDVRVDFRLSERARARFAGNARALGAIVPLPPNGPLGNAPIAGDLSGGLVHIGNVPQWVTGTAPGRYRIVLRGDAQPEGFSNNARPLMKEASIRVWANHPSVILGLKPQRLFKIPVRDWMEPGVVLHYRLSARGQGSEPRQIGGTLRWTAYRMLEGIAILTMKMPTAIMPDVAGRFDPSVDRYASWIQDPSEPGSLIDYFIRDEFIFRALPQGCQEDTSPFEETFERTTSIDDPLVYANARVYLSSMQFQHDLRARTFSAQVATGLSVPTQIVRTTGTPQRSQMQVFADIEMDPADIPRLKLKWPNVIYDRPAASTSSTPGAATYSAIFMTTARYKRVDMPPKTSMIIHGTIDVTVLNGAAPPTEAQWRRLAQDVLARSTSVK